MKRNAGVDGLRGLLMVWIVLYHYTSRYNVTCIGNEITYPITSPHKAGVYGVMLFFIISGYFIGKSIKEEGG